MSESEYPQMSWGDFRQQMVADLRLGSTRELKEVLARRPNESIREFCDRKGQVSRQLKVTEAEIVESIIFGVRAEFQNQANLFGIKLVELVDALIGYESLLKDRMG